MDSVLMEFYVFFFFCSSFHQEKTQLEDFCIAFNFTDHFLSGYISESTFLWADGRSDWLPLSSIPELSTVISVQKASSSSIRGKDGILGYV